MIVKKNNIFEVVPQKEEREIKSSAINWGIFDKIYCIHYLPYKERKQHIITELSKLGILGLSQFEWYYTVPNKYYDFLLYDHNFSKKADGQVNSTNINYTVNSYNLISLAYGLKYNRILIIEDDVCFLKSAQRIKKILDDFPLEYDIVNLEPFMSSTISNLERINSWFRQFTNEIIYDTGCISLSRNAMKEILELNQVRLRPFDGYMSKRIKSSSLKRAVSSIPICIQKLYSNRQDLYISNNKYTINTEDYND